jgi:hypothetical protein
MLDSLPPFGSLGAPTERCLSKIAHWNDRASRGVAPPVSRGVALYAMYYNFLRIHQTLDL